jgi:hypothetical protein
MPKQQQHYLTHTATRSQQQLQLSKISQQTMMYMKTDITYGTPSVCLHDNATFVTLNHLFLTHECMKTSSSLIL